MCKTSAIFTMRKSLSRPLLDIAYQHSWTPKSQSKSDSCFCSHANNPPVRVFYSCRNKMKRQTESRILILLWENPLKQGQNLVFHNWWMKFSGSIHNKWDTFFCPHTLFFIHTGCCTTSQLQDRLSLNFVCRVIAVFCVFVATGV